MTKDYRITTNMLELPIDNNSRPLRFAIATNGLILTKIHNKKHLVLFNIDPVKLNKWYPCFVSHNADCSFSANNYGDLFAEFISVASEKGYTEERRKEAIIKKMQDLLNCKTDIVSLTKMHNDEWWIKYSVSQQVWTIYLFENYKVIVDNLLFEANENICLLPIDDCENEDWFSTGRFNNVEIVDNIYELLKNGLFNE